MLKNYAPKRVWKAFHFLLTVFVTFRKKERFLYVRPLSPAGLKRAILELGVSFIKLAQVLATRADLFSDEYLRELKTIHDEVAPMREDEFEAMYAKAFGLNPPFRSFEPAPIASASIGQVHKAELKDGSPVAVKIRRLGITDKVRDDIRIIRFFLKLFQPFFSRYTKNSLEAVISEFSAMIVKEVDMSMELENLRKFQETYRETGVRFPDFYALHSSADALVMSFESGFRIDDHDALTRLDIHFPALMDTLISFYTEQMLVRGFFNADPHPGNLLVREDGSLVMVDFGMVKRLPKSTRVAMIELVKAAHERDFELLIAACKHLGVVAAGAPQDQMQEMAERLFDIFGNENLSAASMQALAFDLLASMKELPFKLPQEVVYVMRASCLLEGLGTGFIENYNGVKDILPVLRKNLNRALGSEAGLFPTLKGEILGLPMTVRRLKTVLTDMSESNLHVKLSRETLELAGEYARAYLRPIGVGALLIVAGFFALQLDFALHTPLAVVLFALGVLRIFTALK
ncbi:MAG: AarF/UbiB family protein [Thermodesulfobacteriota bacterium]|nr:AarF/UbiB family protein [Thermodesulfobacteriota bacterium]